MALFVIPEAVRDAVRCQAGDPKHAASSLSFAAMASVATAASPRSAGSPMSAGSDRGQKRLGDDALSPGIACAKRLRGRRSSFSRCLRRSFEAVAASPSSISPDSWQDLNLLGALLEGGPYLHITEYLTSLELCRADVACWSLHRLHLQPGGSWSKVGSSLYLGMEVDLSGTDYGPQLFDAPDEKPHPLSSSSAASSSTAVAVREEREPRNWKARCQLFSKMAPAFGPPFGGSEITWVERPDEVAYCRCRLRTDLLRLQPDRGIYIEVEVESNADNLSLAVVDFESGGRSSVTFSPETGAVLRERKVKEQPRAIEGTYIHLLPSTLPGKRFEGKMGLYLRGGHLAFFRRWAERGSDQSTSSDSAVLPDPVTSIANAIVGANHSSTVCWETTGFVTDLQWAQGDRLSVCLAFRDEGRYKVRITHIGDKPPLVPTSSALAYQESNWNLLYGDEDHPLAI